MSHNAAISRFVTAQDGLKLHVWDWRPANEATPLSVICLPGLARSGVDFDDLATALANDPQRPRRVLAIDSRGRGKSDYDPNPANYNLAVEIGDVLAVLTALGLGQAVFIGTSRGGLLTMLLATARPAAIAGCVLNDIGPEIDMTGLMRIKSYVGKLPEPADFADAARILKQVMGEQFPKLSDETWLAWARRSFKEANGRLVPDYDVKLTATLGEVDADKPLPSMWKEFDALANVPMMVVRGANSDILSPKTLAAMRARHSGMQSIEVPDQGHAPLLAEPEVIDKIAAFVASCEQRATAAFRQRSADRCS
ncbi:MAG: alpha/beta fold hydrolase [Xanthobacteraceae bacterium]